MCTSARLRLLGLGARVEAEVIALEDEGANRLCGRFEIQAGPPGPSASPRCRFLARTPIKTEHVREKMAD